LNSSKGAASHASSSRRKGAAMMTAPPLRTVNVRRQAAGDTHACEVMAWRVRVCMRCSVACSAQAQQQSKGASCMQRIVTTRLVCDLRKVRPRQRAERLTYSDKRNRPSYSAQHSAEATLQIMRARCRTACCVKRHDRSAARGVVSERARAQNSPLESRSVHGVLCGLFTLEPGLQHVVRRVRQAVQRVADAERADEDEARRG
jgi:hypothetical protein